MIQALLEAKDLNVYKKLLRVLSDYCDRFPGTGVGKMLKDFMEKGLKTVSGDKRAQDILSCVLSTDDSVPAAVTRLLNMRFADLSIGQGRPIYKDGNGKPVAFWAKDGKVSDRVLSLLNLGDEKEGFWACEKGEKVALLDMSNK